MLVECRHDGPAFVLGEHCLVGGGHVDKAYGGEFDPSSAKRRAAGIQHGGTHVRQCLVGIAEMFPKVCPAAVQARERVLDNVLSGGPVAGQDMREPDHAERACLVQLGHGSGSHIGLMRWRQRELLCVRAHTHQRRIRPIRYSAITGYGSPGRGSPGREREIGAGRGRQQGQLACADDCQPATVPRWRPYDQRLARRV